jgi:predicted ATPase
VGGLSGWPRGRAGSSAVPGSRVRVEVSAGRFELLVRQPGLSRPLSAAELSDGTLRFLLLAVALLSPRPPEILVLNEPETSLHPDLIPALANLIRRSASKTQLVVVTHSPALVDRIARETSVETNLIELCRGEISPGSFRLAKPNWPQKLASCKVGVE